tara:strand:- start:27080 stop:28480 length:1401 start_codon:yes stop_codon:yes gene_type:complete
MSNVVRLANAAQRTLGSMFPGFFPTAKHDHYRDFGFPADLSFQQLYAMYLRNGIAHAGVSKTIGKTWQDQPFLLEKERDGSEGADTDETTIEAEIRKRFAKLRLWQHLAEADGRSLVGKYAGVILRLGDNQTFDKPAAFVPGGLDGLVELIPAWEGQLTVAEWDQDQLSETYGQPKMFAFNEANVATGLANHRAFNIHPSRVIIWSKDGTVHGRSALEPGFNDLMTMEKISGAGGEGFWKNAKSAPVFEVDKDAKIAEMAKAMGVAQADLADAMNDQVEDWQKGFDQLLMIQGMQAKTLGITLPSPEHFFNIALQAFAASLSIPLKILVGSQTGERASTEDSDDWAQTNMARRANVVVPNIMMLVERLVGFRILPEKDWFLDWPDLTEASMGEKIDRAGKMADVNQKTGTTEWVFTPEEIRKTVGYEPLTPGQTERDDTTDEDETAALGLPSPGNEPSGDQSETAQ